MTITTFELLQSISLDNVKRFKGTNYITAKANKPTKFKLQNL